ncbi:hypothetical protein GGP41_008396 [Bipolaris sorokiniana]|uniref:Uncharacterized protein n=1 Tax=Cochliobolus sativus TaxID=45130 RepID=A0A8H6DS15_COCSA|nr:hypothetical protein GGP41_008396 [Bipolaris sorokiniana]
MLEYIYWDVKTQLEDIFLRVDLEICIGVFVSCAFDFRELIGDEVEGLVGVMDSLNRNNWSSLHVVTRNGSYISLNYRNGKDVMSLLLDKRGDKV